LKLNICLDDSGKRTGYHNAVLSRGLVRADNLGEMAVANECDEVLALGVLDRFHSELADPVLSHWLSRLAHGGELCLSVTDVREVARAYLADGIDLDRVDSLLHGEGPYPRGCCLTLGRLVDVLEGRGMEIVTKRVQDFQAVVRCRRP